MKRLMEGWKIFLQEGVDTRIQKRIDALLAKSNVGVRVAQQFGQNKRTNVRVSYVLIKEDGKYVEIGPAKAEAEGLPFGFIRAMEVDPSSGNCVGAFEVNMSEAAKGWGPLLYEVCLEWASKNGGGLVSDRVSVSSDATQVWQKYSQRGDVDAIQMDLTNMNTKDFGLDQLTPDDESDDCEQQSPYDANREEWWRSPLSRAYKKKTFEVTQALEKAGRLVREDR